MIETKKRVFISEDNLIIDFNKPVTFEYYNTKTDKCSGGIHLTLGDAFSLAYGRAEDKRYNNYEFWIYTDKPTGNFESIKRGVNVRIKKIYADKAYSVSKFVCNKDLAEDYVSNYIYFVIHSPKHYKVSKFEVSFSDDERGVYREYNYCPTYR